ncbi:MAG: hypothetical protein OHK0039_07400 [Bacteroidia bacterium]
MNTAGQLKGCKILILGADLPLGTALADGLHRQGADLVLSGSNRRQLERLARRCVAPVGLPLGLRVDAIIQALPSPDSLLRQASDMHPRERIRQLLACLKPEGTFIHLMHHSAGRIQQALPGRFLSFLGLELLRLRVRVIALPLRLGGTVQEVIDTLPVLLRTTRKPDTDH